MLPYYTTSVKQAGNPQCCHKRRLGLFQTPHWLFSCPSLLGVYVRADFDLNLAKHHGIALLSGGGHSSYRQLHCSFTAASENKAAMLDLNSSSWLQSHLQLYSNRIWKWFTEINVHVLKSFASLLWSRHKQFMLVYPLDSDHTAFMWPRYTRHNTAFKWRSYCQVVT